MLITIVIVLVICLIFFLIWVRKHPNSPLTNKLFGSETSSSTGTMWHSVTGKSDRTLKSIITGRHVPRMVAPDSKEADAFLLPGIGSQDSDKYYAKKVTDNKYYVLDKTNNKVQTIEYNKIPPKTIVPPAIFDAFAGQEKPITAKEYKQMLSKPESSEILDANVSEMTI